MCYDASESFEGNKVLVCQVGDLDAGQRYRTPDGKTLMVLANLPEDHGSSYVADLDSGEAFTVGNSTKLGRDRAGRLYASRSLNMPITAPTDDTIPVILPDDTVAGIAFPSDDVTRFNNRHED